MVYVAGGGGEARTLVWVDRQGKEEVLNAEPRAYSRARISPDGNLVALEVRDQENEIWIWDFARETTTRLTFAPGYDGYAVWTPDGATVVFSSSRDGIANLYGKAADGTGAVERLTESEQRPFRVCLHSGRAASWCFSSVSEPKGRTWECLPSKGLQSRFWPPSSMNATRRSRQMAGGWPTSRTTRAKIEIYVRPFPNVDEGRWPITRDGGSRPLWAPDGQELLLSVSRRGAHGGSRTQTESGLRSRQRRGGRQGRNFHAPLNYHALAPMTYRSDGKRFSDDQATVGREFLNGDHPHPKLVPRARTPRPHRALARPRLLIKPVLLQIPP